jgi:hypothetical protein
MECDEDGFHFNYWFNRFMIFLVCVGVRLLVVSLPLVEAIYIIQAQWDLGFDIPNSVQVVV